MKTTVKVALISLLTIFAGWLFYQGGRIAVGTDGESIAVNDYQTRMMTARETFLERSDSIQLLAQRLMEQPGLRILTTAEGETLLETEGGECAAPETALDDETLRLLGEVTAPYTCGGHIYNIQTTDKAVLYYTDYGEGSGCCGFLYEIEANSTNYYDYISLVENEDPNAPALGRWLIFYRLPDDYA